MSTRKRKRSFISDDSSSISTIFSSSSDEDDPFVGTSLKRFKKSYVVCSTNDEIIKAILENADFSISPVITSLIIKNVEKAGKDSCRNLALALGSDSTNITRVELHNCSLDLIHAALQSNPTSKNLTELVIKNDKLKETGDLRHLAALPKLQVLWLENYILSMETIKHLFGTVLIAARLKKLVIINANLTKFECALLTDGLIGNTGGPLKLASLNLSHNPIKTTLAITPLVEFTNPDELDVTNCQITDDGLLPICNVLRRRQIKDLKLGQNNIGQRSLNYLISKVKNNFSLISLDLRGIKFNPDCITILNTKLDSKTLKTILLDVALPRVTDITTKNRLLEGFDFANFIQLVANDKWGAVQEILKQKPTVPLDSIIPIDEIPVTKVHKVYTVAIEALTNHVANLSEKLKEDTAKKAKEKERVEYLNKKKIELEAELKKIVAELKDAPNVQQSEDALKARAKEIESHTNSLKQRRSSMQATEFDIGVWKAIVKRDVTGWSTDEVQKFMQNIGLGAYKAILNHNQVTGSVLIHLTTTDYQQLGFTYPHTMRVLKALFVAKYFQSIDAPPGVLQWTVQEVKDWLTKNKFQSLTDTFVNNQTPDLKDWLKIDTLADRVRLEQAIAVLKSSVIEGKQQPEVRQKPKVPSHFKCPITTEIMKDPVFTSDGHTYERTAIEQWLLNHDTSPMTNEKLANKQLHPCHFLKNMIAEFLQQQQH